MNADLVNQALKKVGNANVLVNMISRRVRQLNAGGQRPLLKDTGTMGVADIALLEIVEEKMEWEMPEVEEVVRPVRKRKKAA
jgi:DNA-directed RNA polymerase subunit omega